MNERKERKRLLEHLAMEFREGNISFLTFYSWYCMLDVDEEMENKSTSTSENNLCILPIEIDSSLVEASVDTLAELNLDITTAIRIFLGQVVKQKSMPFNISN